MARNPTNRSAPATGAQPWANNGDNAAGAPAPAASDSATGEGAGEATGNGGGEQADSAGAGEGQATSADTIIASTADVPGAEGPMPGQDTDDVDVHDTHEQADRLVENDVASTGSKELPSIVRDQVSPSGIDIALEADRSLKPSLERSAYPSLGERLNNMLLGASSELQQEFEDRMADLAEQVIEELRAKNADDVFSANVVDGTSHYGPKVRSEAASKPVPATGAEANRRARRAAERLQAQAVAARK